MIKTFADKLTEQLANGISPKRFPADIVARSRMRLVQLDNATCLDDLRVPPSNRLEPLVGDRKGQYSIRINQQWRVCFEFRNGDAYRVEICDYH